MMNKIESTKDYEVFKDVIGNRATKSNHINKLKFAMKQDPQITEYNPILVNEKMEVIDGQHRLKAIKELGLSVHYIKVSGLTLKNVQDLNSNTKAWTPSDYARAYSITGNTNYDFYLDHKEEFKFNHDITLQYSGFPNQGTGESFKNGNYRKGNKAKVMAYSNYLRDIKPYLEHAYVRSTALALLDMFQHDEYDHDRMVKQMKKCGLRIERYNRKEESLIPLARAYNKGLSTKNYITFTN